MDIVYIGVGSNVDREKYTRIAIDELLLLDSELKVSPIYECEPIGFESDPFYNFVIELRTSLNLTEFSHALREVEFKWGRKSEAKKYEDRCLDLDVLLFGELVSHHSPVIPREDIFKYPFVIQPLYDLNPDLVIPNDGRKVKDIWQTMESFDSLSQVNFVY